MATALAQQPGRIGVNGHSLTLEQEAIIALPPTETRKWQAYAGCAKTTTSVEYTHAWPSHRGLYLAFNAAIAGDAKGKFPHHILTQTAHGHAYQAMGINRFRDRLVTRIRPNDLLSCRDLIRPINDMTEIAVLRAILRTLNNFLISAEDRVEEYHLQGFPVRARASCLSMVSNVIERLMDYENNGLAFTHDIYLKAFARERKISDQFDYLIIDEAQDLNPVLIDIVRKAKRPAMIVGDPYQSIYAFRGAMSAMDSFNGTIHPLSQSFRFGPKIAEVANNVLSHSLKRPKLPIVGFDAKNSVVTEYQGKVKRPSTILARTNFRLFEGLVTTTLPFHVVGGIDEMLNQVAAGYALYKEQRPKIIDPLVSHFASWSDCKEAAEAEDEPELTRLVRIIEQYTDAIPEILAGLRARHCPDERRAALIVSTAHKAKGREWPHVIVLDDFMPITQLKAMLARKRITPREYDQEINLTYVTLTRAIRSLAISQPLYDEVAGGHGLSNRLFDVM